VKRKDGMMEHWKNDGMKGKIFFCGLKPNIPKFHYSTIPALEA
jgi:hypothetical protein